MQKPILKLTTFFIAAAFLAVGSYPANAGSGNYDGNDRGHCAGAEIYGTSRDQQRRHQRLREQGQERSQWLDSGTGREGGSATRDID